MLRFVLSAQQVFMAGRHRCERDSGCWHADLCESSGNTIYNRMQKNAIPLACSRAACARRIQPDRAKDVKERSSVFSFSFLARCFDVVNVERQPDTDACLDEPHKSGYLTNMENR